MQKQSVYYAVGTEYQAPGISFIISSDTVFTQLLVLT
jgi:hypothetical protein